ncbi:MAG TPA: hopanoid-associated sugar epimerase [Bryobacteraceae bacterium]|nr:hopanoid-associated sugar epimerase [Bryobacteraceae bacterium]
MKPVLVTGATGFVGWHVARLLVERGEKVRVLVRDPKRVRESDAEIVTGDLTDPLSIEKAVTGCGVVYHVAADYRLWVKDSTELYRSNVDGTRNMLTAARKARVDRLIYTSTVGCIGIPKDGIGDEENSVTEQDMQGVYKRSKYLAEQVALEFAREKFPVVIVNPTAPVGDHDWKPTPTGKIVVDFVRGKMPAYVDTGLNVVDVRDVAAGHLLACERGRIGERYILGGENLTLCKIFEKLEGISGQKAPKVRIPYGVAYAAGVVSTAWARISGVEPRAPLDGVRMARKKMWVRHDKAASELGYAPGPAPVALQRAVEWFRANAYV